jgi:putative endopeptidase
MRTLGALALFSLAALPPGASRADGPPLHGIEAADLDRKVAPCEDFYGFANGSWRKSHPIPDYMPRWSRRWEAGEKNKDALQSILEESVKQSGAPTGSVEQLIGDYYAACMDAPRANALGTKPVAARLAAIAALRSPADVQRMLRDFMSYGLSAPLTVSSGADLHDPAHQVAHFGVGGLGLPDRDYYLKDEPRFVEARARYRQHIGRMFALYGARPREAESAADVILRVETRLAQAQLDNVALREPKNIDHKMSFAELQKLAPHLMWAALFDALQLPRSDVNVEQPRLVAQLDELIAQQPVADWRVYLRWQLMNEAAPELSDAIVAADFDFYGKYLSGATQLKPRGKRCAEEEDRLLGEALGQKYVARYFPPEAKARMQELARNVLAAMKQTIDTATWMTPPTRKKALEKLATFEVHVGYPDKWKDYRTLAVGRDDHFGNWMAARRWNVAEQRAQIGKPTDRGRWEMTPATSDASYDPTRNVITFPAGILQPPAFDVHAVDAVNYGAIGVVIGHEVSHGFDDEGAQFDGSGRLANWWTDVDLKQFQARGQCVVDQFESYFIEPGIHHQGKLVLGESIGDLAGAKIAHLAFQLAQRGRPPQPTIDGFTPEQQFFIAWGQFRGDQIRPEQQRLMVQGDRVIGPLSNLPSFQSAFQCKADAPMVRPAAKRCEVW